jgi:hypothetical protein
VKKYAVALVFLLVASGCGGSSDTATPATTVAPAATQASTTTAVPTTTVAATTTTAATTGFDQADLDEFFEWCVEYRLNSASDLWQCGEIADLLAVDINEKGLKKDCAIRLVKRAIVSPPEPTKFTSGRDDWARYPLPYDVNVSLGTECRTGSDLPDPLENPIDLVEAVACSDLGLEERKAGVRVAEYYEVQAFVLIDPDIAPGGTNWFLDYEPWDAPIVKYDASYLARQLEEAMDSLCPQQASVVNAFSDWLIALEPNYP